MVLLDYLLFWWGTQCATSREWTFTLVWGWGDVDVSSTCRCQHLWPGALPWAAKPKSPRDEVEGGDFNGFSLIRTVRGKTFNWFAPWFGVWSFGMISFLLHQQSKRLRVYFQFVSLSSWVRAMSVVYTDIKVVQIKSRFVRFVCATTLFNTHAVAILNSICWLAGFAESWPSQRKTAPPDGFVWLYFSGSESQRPGMAEKQGLSFEQGEGVEWKNPFSRLLVDATTFHPKWIARPSRCNSCCIRPSWSQQMGSRHFENSLDTPFGASALHAKKLQRRPATLSARAHKLQRQEKPRHGWWSCANSRWSQCTYQVNRVHKSDLPNFKEFVWGLREASKRFGAILGGCRWNGSTVDACFFHSNRGNSGCAAAPWDNGRYWSGKPSFLCWRGWGFPVHARCQHLVVHLVF